MKNVYTYDSYFAVKKAEKRAKKLGYKVKKTKLENVRFNSNVCMSDIRLYSIYLTRQSKKDCFRTEWIELFYCECE